MATKRQFTIDRIFSKDSVREILRRPFYIGLIEYRGGEGVAEERKKFKTAQSTYQGKHQPIISPQLFEQCQSIRRQHGHRPNRANNSENLKVYPLSRLLYAWPHRSKMRSVSNGSGQRIYRDRDNIGKSRLDTSPRSPQPNVRAEIAERQVLDILNTLTLPNDWRQRIIACLVAPEFGITEVESHRRDLLARLDRLKYLFKSGDLSQEKYAAQKAQLETEFNQLMRIPDLDNQAVRDLLNNLPRLWQSATPAQLKDLFETVFQQIFIQNEQIVRLIVYPDFLPLLQDPQHRLVHPADDADDDQLSLGQSG